MNWTIPGKVVENLLLKQLDYNHLITFLNIVNNVEDPFPQFAQWCSMLKRRGLIDSDKQLTEKGVEYLDFLAKHIDVSCVSEKVEAKKDFFQEFWEKYPATDKWQSFPNDGRPLRFNKEKARKMYMEILQSGEFSHAQIMEALETEIVSRKKKSLNSGENQLSFMKGIIPYLNQKSFEAYIGFETSAPKTESIIVRMT